MKVTKNKISRALEVGDIVYMITKGGYTRATVLEIEDDCLNTDVDLLFYDEIGKSWCLCEVTAKRITRESQKNML